MTPKEPQSHPLSAIAFAQGTLAVCREGQSAITLGSTNVTLRIFSGA